MIFSRCPGGARASAPALFADRLLASRDSSIRVKSVGTSRKSPIEPLVRLREGRADDAARALADAASGKTAADAQVIRERDERQRVERELAAVRAAERADMERGVLRAGDLAQGARWSIEEARARDAAQAALDDARKRAAEAAAVVDASRARVAQAKADVDVATRMLDKERKARAAHEIAVMEEAGEESFAARARSRG
jgi:hypothetical protein